MCAKNKYLVPGMPSMVAMIWKRGGPSVCPRLYDHCCHNAIKLQSFVEESRMFEAEASLLPPLVYRFMYIYINPWFAPNRYTPNLYWKFLQLCVCCFSTRPPYLCCIFQSWSCQELPKQIFASLHLNFSMLSSHPFYLTYTHSSAFLLSSPAVHFLTYPCQTTPCLWVLFVFSTTMLI